MNGEFLRSPFHIPINGYFICPILHHARCVWNEHVSLHHPYLPGLLATQEGLPTKRSVSVMVHQVPPWFSDLECLPDSDHIRAWSWVHDTRLL